MKSKELRYAAFITSGGLLLGLATRLINAGVLLPGVVALAATVGLVVLARRRAKEQQGEEALKAAEEYDRLHGDDSDGPHGSKEAS